MELHFGDLQGRFRDERDPEASRMMKEWRANMFSARPPGGESLEELSRRVARFLHELFDDADAESVLVVGHRHTNRVLLGTLLGLQLSAWGELRQKCGQLLRIERSSLPLIRTIRLDRRAPQRKGIE
jgi:broad specificity phosphatase PhoE